MELHRGSGLMSGRFNETELTSSTVDSSDAVSHIRLSYDANNTTLESISTTKRHENAAVKSGKVAVCAVMS